MIFFSLFDILGLLKKIRDKGYKAYTAFSFTGYLFSLKAGIAVVTHSRLTDLNCYAISPRTKIIQMWHGIPLKKIYYDDEKSAQRLSRKNSKIKEFVFPFLKERFDLLITTSSEFQNLAAKAFRIAKNSIKVTGYPRDDVFFNKPKISNKEKKIIYLPTLRKSVGSEIDMFYRFSFVPEKISEILQKYSAELYLKLHPANRFEQRFKAAIDDFHNINILLDIDIYESIGEYDILITDLSSIYFDFLLTGKPMIFAAFDIDAYQKYDHDLYYEYDKITPGLKAANWNEIMDCVAKILAGDDEFDKERELIRNRFFAYNDGNNSARVFKSISDLCKE